MFRLIGVRHPDSGEYRFYVKNIDPEIFDAEDIAQLYAARWQVEICQPWCLLTCVLDQGLAALRDASYPTRTAVGVVA
jgi:IS4 transposase